MCRDGRWEEVDKQDYVLAERAAGFRNSMGLQHEPATSAFSGMFGERGKITYLGERLDMQWLPQSRLWTYPRREYRPRWWRYFLPHLGGDEYGRRVLILPILPFGWLLWAYRTCYCEECAKVRQQTLRWLGGSEDDAQ